MGDVAREYESDYANFVLHPDPEDLLEQVDLERKREKESGENPRYGSGNPDWERDFQRTKHGCSCSVDLPAVDGACLICRRPK